MLRNIKSLLGSIVAANDGNVGKVDDFYFDDETWTIRYFVVNTGNWLAEREVLIAPSSFGRPDWLAHKIPVNLTRENVKRSPLVDLQKPITREQEEELHQYYNWPPYWNAMGLADYPTIGMGIDTQMLADYQEKERERAQRRASGLHLHSAKKVMGYQVQALDGAIGHIRDFQADDRNWEIRYAIIDTRNWFPGRTVIIGSKRIKDFSWLDSKAVVNLSRQRIRHSPKYEPHAPLGLR